MSAFLKLIGLGEHPFHDVPSRYRFSLALGAG